jgi:hypothetical protein
VPKAEPLGSLNVRITGASLKNDETGRNELKAKGFHWNPAENAWRGRIPRVATTIAEWNVWAQRRGLEIDFAPVEG